MKKRIIERGLIESKQKMSFDKKLEQYVESEEYKSINDEDKKIVNEYMETKQKSYKSEMSVRKQIINDLISNQKKEYVSMCFDSELELLSTKQ